MEKAQQIMKDKLNTASLFVTPPGFNQWPSALQRFVYLVTEICQCRGVDFAICAPNMRVSGKAFRPSWLSYMGYIVSGSKILQTMETTGNSHLTLDDAIHFDHGTRMALLMFSAEAERRLPELTIAECEAIRLHNWKERARSSGKKTSIKTDLAEATAEMGKVTDTREIGRAIQRVRYSTDICLTKMSLGVKYIVAKLTWETYEEIQACDTTYDGWDERLRACKVADVAKELGLTTGQFPLCLGLGWNLGLKKARS